MADPNKRPIIIKKKVVHGGHHGGAWKVAYADFVTAMMALFIVLWLLSSSAKVKEAVSGYFKDPLGRGKEIGSTIHATGRDVSPKESMKEIAEKIKSAIKMMPHFNELKNNIELTITEEGLRIELFENSKGMFFESGRPEPSPIGKELLIALARELGQVPNQILIEGHTDATPYESTNGYSNWELSADRSNQARRLMEQNGLHARQVIQIRGYADESLRNKNNPMDPANRRVSLLVRYLEPAAEVKLGKVEDLKKSHAEPGQGKPTAESHAAKETKPAHGK